MKMERIVDPMDFSAVYRLMEQAFPKCERRTGEKARALLAYPKYHIYAVRKEGAICGFISAWDLDDFRFVEHFAVAGEMRGAGIGSRMMRIYLRQSRRPVCLEVEAPDTEEAVRRVSFYRRLGFRFNDFGYVQPDLQDTDRKVFLNIMSYPDELTESGFMKIKNVLFPRVYGVEGESQAVPRPNKDAGHFG